MADHLSSGERIESGTVKEEEYFWLNFQILLHSSQELFILRIFLFSATLTPSIVSLCSSLSANVKSILELTRFSSASQKCKTYSRRACYITSSQVMVFFVYRHRNYHLIHFARSFREPDWTAECKNNCDWKSGNSSINGHSQNIYLMHSEILFSQQLIVLLSSREYIMLHES